VNKSVHGAASRHLPGLNIRRLPPRHIHEDKRIQVKIGLKSYIVCFLFRGIRGWCRVAYRRAGASYG
jgi:hypothetical protein